MVSGFSNSPVGGKKKKKYLYNKKVLRTESSGTSAFRQQRTSSVYMVYFSLARSFLQKTKETEEVSLNEHILFSSRTLLHVMEKDTKVNAT